MDRFLVVCAGSAIGGGVRYLVSVATKSVNFLAIGLFGTLVVNVVGCFLIMMILTIATATSMSTNARLFLTTGFLGGLTTYSTFDYETTKLVQEGAPGKAIAYLGTTLVLCFVAGLGGYYVARAVVGSPS